MTAKVWCSRCGKFIREDKRSATVIERQRHVVITGHFLNYVGSYAEEADLPPEQTGCPIINLHGDMHTVRVLT